MYIDEAGVEDKNDLTKFFVTSGAIFHEDDLADMKKKVQSFKDSTFTGAFQGNEIHVHDIFKGKKTFEGISLQQIDEYLTGIYNLVNSDLKFSTISVAIDKYGVKKAFPEAQHLAKAGLTKPHVNNNRIERMHGTQRERVKIQRGWKKVDTPIQDGMKITITL